MQPISILDILQREGEPERFLAGDIVIEQGAPGDFMYYVLSGEVKVTAGGKDIYVIKAGNTVSEMAIISDHPRSANVVANTDCELVRVDQKRFE